MRIEKNLQKVHIMFVVCSVGVVYYIVNRAEVFYYLAFVLMDFDYKSGCP